MRVHSGVWSDRGSHECNARVPLEEEDAVRIHELPRGGRKGIGGREGGGGGGGDE